MIDEKCSFCDIEATGWVRPIYLSGDVGGWALHEGGDIIYHCQDHIIDANALCAICEEAETDVPITEHTLTIIEARKERFIAKHFGSRELAEGAIVYSNTSPFGNLARHCTDDFI